MAVINAWSCLFKWNWCTEEYESNSMYECVCVCVSCFCICVYMEYVSVCVCVCIMVQRPKHTLTWLEDLQCELSQHAPLSLPLWCDGVVRSSGPALLVCCALFLAGASLLGMLGADAPPPRALSAMSLPVRQCVLCPSGLFSGVQWRDTLNTQRNLSCWDALCEHTHTHT